jgi:hypothetical protein
MACDARSAGPKKGFLYKTVLIVVESNIAAAIFRGSQFIQT